MRVVLDTNVFVSGLLVKESIPSRILYAFKEEKFILIISLEIISEILEVLIRPRFNLEREKIFEIMSAIEIKSEKVIIPFTKKGIIMPYAPDDEKFLWCAEIGQADFIVSGDKHLLKVKKYKSIKIITPKEFIKILFPN
jgi:putative PIN family toxin of toxin-antitoxin system